jgi:hypothetical protein
MNAVWPIIAAEAQPSSATATDSTSESCFDTSPAGSERQLEPEKPKQRVKAGVIQLMKEW